MSRPYPPAAMIADPEPLFVAARELEEWAQMQFINEISPLNNPDHAHLSMAQIGFVWTNVANVKRGRTILGQAQLITESGEKWAQGRTHQQLREWFGRVPTFLITLYAPHAMICTDAELMALTEHELYHCGQERDEFGQPKFSKSSGLPIYAMRAHDVEEFVGVVRRYGADAAGVREMVSAANKGPEIAEGLISRACGSCLRLVKS